MGWVLRLAETGPDAAAESIDLIEIDRSCGLADIANLGRTLPEAKELLARVQRSSSSRRSSGFTGGSGTATRRTPKLPSIEFAR